MQVKKTYNYIHKYGHKSKLMAAAVRNKQDIFSLLGYDKQMSGSSVGYKTGIIGAKFDLMFAFFFVGLIT